METVELMDFDSWHSLREEMIPDHHHKEILRADFKARKVPMESATIEEFDKALEQYGIKL